jgi:serine/threonine protein kinase
MHVSSIQVREGDLVAGKYRIERVLGVGGMGIVVAARHEQLDQLVAIKFVRDEALRNDEAVERFLREARSAAKLKSEHVARVLDVGRLESGAPYMVMEFLDGTDLAQALTRDGPMPLELAARLMLQVCEAVAEAHAAGIVHRDLKPENLFLTRTVGGSPRMKVLDFGVSKAAPLAGGGKGLLTGTRAILGSPLYMAPEQMRSSRDVDSRIDVWALGVVLFELLTVRSPFEAETMPELCLKVVAEPPLSLAGLRPDLPPEIIAVVERCLEKDKEKRYANAAELAAALQPFAPPRPSAFSGRSSRLPDSLSGNRIDVPPSAAAAPLPMERNASSPAAWGTEQQNEPVASSPKPRRAAIWVSVLSVAVAAVVVFFVVRRPVGERSSSSAARPSASAPSSSALLAEETPPAVPAISPVAEAASAPPSALAAPSNEAAAGTSATPEARAAPLVAPLAPPPPPRVAPQPAARATNGPTVRGSDDDIPALR